MANPIAIATVRTSIVFGLRLLIQAATLLLVARSLGPKQFGIFASITALALLLGTLSTFGTHLMLLGAASKDPDQRNHVLPYAIPLTLICGGLLLIVFLLICMMVLNGDNVSWYVLLMIGGAELLLQPLLAFPVTELLASERTARSQLLQILPMALRVFAAGSVFVWQPSDPLTAYSYGYALATLFSLILALFYMPQPWPSLKDWRMPTLVEMRESASFAALHITAIGPAELDKVLASKLLSSTAAGLYAAAARMVGAVTFPVIALMLSAMPRLFREGASQPERTMCLMRWIFTATLIYSLTLAVILWSCASWFIPLLGSKYHGVDEVVRWLCIAVPGIALRIAAGAALMALGQPWMRTGFEIMGVFALVLAAATLTSFFGQSGMPLATACSEWIMAIIGISLVIRLQRINNK